DECLIGITVDYDDVAFLVDAVRGLTAQFLARRIVLEQIGKERAKRLLSLDPESCASYCGYHVVGNVCQESVDIALGARLSSLPVNIRDLLGRISLRPDHSHRSQQQDQREKPAQHSEHVLLHPAARGRPHGGLGCQRSVRTAVLDDLLKVGEEGSRRWRRSAPHFPGWSRSRSTAATKSLTLSGLL